MEDNFVPLVVWGDVKSGRPAIREAYAANVVSQLRNQLRRASADRTALGAASPVLVSQIREALAELAVPSVKVDPYLTLKQLAAYSGFSKRQLYRLLADPVDPLPRYGDGKQTRVKLSDFDRWMAKRRTWAGADLDGLVRDVAKELERP